ncbi:LmeA family phospholipid-binding protein [Streptomyces sp. CMB-StM0423]|uniref:LmeA family phospholipid-binding protein n=1 Tax=Streptomyces sp. CMB-StM0423 TaxID=2059884 RepID=UPI000C703EA2|nr:DUF2993 domain-containing protein [Streptomyces sp. CMB-StM0423]AUH39022.1 DUF2993 domain-containing protein [Streptomyces sp. CMB-StM0423]
MRGLRILLVVCLVLGVLFVAADRLTVYIAEGKVAEKIQARQGLEGSTDVSINGFPFLTQVYGKHLDDVDVTMTGIRADPAAAGTGERLMISEFSVDLSGVELDGDYGGATAESAEGSAVIAYEALSLAAGQKGVRFAYGGEGKVKVTASAATLNAPEPAEVLSTVSTEGGDTIRLEADEVPVAGVPGAEETVRGAVDLEQRVGGLPDGVRLEMVTATADGIVVDVTGEGIRVAG